MSSGHAEAQARLVLGTAGHIDHGKTALVRALTGVDCDRLPEEKERGITIELGFARLELPAATGPALECSVIDVPGHEKLVRTMVAGASGIDAVLLVVAGDEGVMPQTREHVAVCDLLGIETGVVAVTKADLVDEETCELAAAEIEDLLETTALAGAPVVAVSSTTGLGLEALRAALHDALAKAQARTPRAGPPRLGIDRAFAMKGFGTVVTGTLLGSPLEVGARVVVHGRDGGNPKPARVRGLQAHGETAERIEPGGRCAVNLQGVEVAELSRGDVLTLPEALRPSATLDVELRWLATPPRFAPTVSVEVLAGSAERRAHVAAIGEPPQLPGEAHFARIHLDDGALALLPGDRFVLRGFARSADGGATLGGGRVLDVNPPHRRRSDAALREELAKLAGGRGDDALGERIVRAGLAGVRRDDLLRELGWPATALDAALVAGAERGAFVAAGDGLWLACAAFERIERALYAAVEAHHAAEALRPGIGRAALVGQLPENVATQACECALERLTAAGRVEIDGGIVRRAGFAPQIDAGTEGLLARMRQRADAAGLDPPSVREWAEELGLAREAFRDLCAHLERGGEWVAAGGGELWFARSAVNALRARVVAHFAEHESLDTATYKTLTGTTRRTTVPLMELLDDWKVTRRRGDVRVAGPAARPPAGPRA